MKRVTALFVLMGLNASFAGSYDDFFRAIKRDDAQAAQQLLARGFDANTPDSQGHSGLSLALRESSSNIANALIDWPQTDLNALSAQGESPLMLASIKGQFGLVEKMIKKGADINKTGWTPLHYAASAGQVKVMGLLLEHHAYIDAESPNGSTPLMMASMYGNAASVKLLLEQGADPLLRNQQGLTALQFAERANRPDSITLLVDAAKATRAQRPPAGW